MNDMEDVKERRSRRPPRSAWSQTVRTVQRTVGQLQIHLLAALAILWSWLRSLLLVPARIAHMVQGGGTPHREPPTEAVPAIAEPAADEVLAMLDTLKSELDGEAREKVNRLARTIAEERTARTPAKSPQAQSSRHGTPASALQPPAPQAPPASSTPSSAMPSSKVGSSSALSAAGGFLRRTFSFGRLPPLPPTPPKPLHPSRTVTAMRDVYKWVARTFPDLFWAMTAYRTQSFEVPKSTERREIKQAVLRAPQVLSAIKVSAEVNGITPEQSARNAERIFETMAANMWLPVVRVIGYLLRKVFRLLYPFGMDVGTSDLQRVKEAARKGPIIYLPNHKSYLDFLVISYICFRHGLPLPHVVSGENLNIPLVGPILRSGGAFFIRRTFNSGADPLFRSVFNEYVTQLLIRGRAVECFIEGGRSRTGKVLPPKPGFMRCVLDAVIDRHVGDVYVVPISLGYDRIVENDSYIKELTGGKKNAERLFAFLKSSTTLIINTITSHRNYGKINVGIAEPISMYDYILNNLQSLPEGSLAVGSAVISTKSPALLMAPLPAPGAATAGHPATTLAPGPTPPPGRTKPPMATAASASASAAAAAAAAVAAAEDAAAAHSSPEAVHDDHTSPTSTAPDAGTTTDTDSEDGGLSLRPRRSEREPARDGLAGLVEVIGNGPAGRGAPGTHAGISIHTVQRPSFSLIATTPSPATPQQFAIGHRGSVGAAAPPAGLAAAVTGGAGTSTSQLEPGAGKGGASSASVSASASTAVAAAAAAAAATQCPLPPPSAFGNVARKYLTVAVGYKVMYEINKVSTVLPATLVGTILFTQYGRGIRESDLVKKVQWLRRKVIMQGGRVQMVPEDALHDSIMATVDQVLAGSVKGKLVKRHKDILMLSVYSPAERMELSLYRNQLIHLFVSEGILLCSFYACELESNSNPAWVEKEDLRASVQFLSQMLKLEFIFKPAPGIDVILDQTVYSLVDQGILMREEQDGNRERYCVNDQLGADGEYQGTYTYLFICSLFWPFIDSYLLSALSCYRLLPDRMLDEDSLIRWTQTLGETLYFEGMLDLYEAISKDTLSNGLVLLENWGVIHFVSIESDVSVGAPGRPNRRIVQLTAAYREESAVEKLVLKIMRFRKRLRAFRSRRYKSRSNNQNMDVINLVKRSDMNPVKAV